MKDHILYSRYSLHTTQREIQEAMSEIFSTLVREAARVSGIRCCEIINVAMELVSNLSNETIHRKELWVVITPDGVFLRNGITNRRTQNRYFHLIFQAEESEMTIQGYFE